MPYDAMKGMSKKFLKRGKKRTSLWAGKEEKEKRD